MSLDGRLLATSLRPGMARAEVSARLGGDMTDLGWVDAGYHIVQWILDVESGSRTAAASVECHFDRDGILTTCEPWGRWHVQRVTRAQLDALPQRARLADVVASLCSPETLDYAPETGGILLRYTLPLTTGKHSSAFVELRFDRDSRLSEKKVYIK
jgi:hypothetical protein